MKTFKHSGGGGDMLYGMATMYHLGGGILHLNLDKRLKFYRRLLLKQPYVEDIIYHSRLTNEWREFKADYNLDLFRGQPFNGGYTLVECHAMAMGIKFDLTKPWFFNVEPKHEADIVINDTGKIRWEGVTVDWEQLRGYEDRAIFIGLKGEYENFVRDRKMKVRYFEIKDCMHFAQVIKGSKLYLGNQSTGLAVAEGLKHPRVADIYIGLSKQYPKGENGHYKLTKELIDIYLNDNIT